MKSLARYRTHGYGARVALNFAIAFVIFALVVGRSNVLAQSGAGSIQGTVTDSTGAVIPDALIHVVNTATNVAEDTKSNSVGFYQVPDLFTGTLSGDGHRAGYEVLQNVDRTPCRSKR